MRMIYGSDRLTRDRLVCYGRDLTCAVLGVEGLQQSSSSNIVSAECGMMDRVSACSLAIPGEDLRRWRVGE